MMANDPEETKRQSGYDLSSLSKETRGFVLSLLLDLRKPLDNIRGFAHLAQDELDDEDFSADKLRETLTELSNSIDRLPEDLKDFSKRMHDQ